MNVSSLRLARDQLLPCITAFADDLGSVLLVLALSAERKLVLRLTIWDLVDAEPFVGGAKETRKVTLNVLDVIELGSQRIVYVNHDDLPVSLFLVEQSHYTKDFDLLDLACVSDEFADFANVKWVIVALRFGLGVHDVRIFPGLRHVSDRLSSE